MRGLICSEKRQYMNICTFSYQSTRHYPQQLDNQHKYLIEAFISSIISISCHRNTGGRLQPLQRCPVPY